jgi:hypothetical protein
MRRIGLPPIILAENVCPRLTGSCHSLNVLKGDAPVFERIAMAQSWF